MLDIRGARGYRAGMENRQRAIQAIVTSLTLIGGILLAGCTSSAGGGVETAEPAPAPETITASPEAGPVWVQQFVYAGEQSVRWGDDTMPHIILTTYGSGSCPDVPATLEVVDESTLEVTLEPPSQGDCTADLRPTVFAGERPAGLNLSEEITVTIDGVLSGTLPPLER